jgi:hypothetical protein
VNISAIRSLVSATSPYEVISPKKLSISSPMPAFQAGFFLLHVPPWGLEARFRGRLAI